MGALTITTMPVYAGTMASTEWGLVAFCATVQNFVLIIERILAPLMARDVASVTRPEGVWRVFQAYSRLYNLMAATGLAFALFLVLISRTTNCCGLALLADAPLVWCGAMAQLSFQLANASATGYWNGTQQQHKSNRRAFGFAALKHTVALVVVTQFAAFAVAYVVTFAAVGYLELLFNRRNVLRDIELTDVSGDSSFFRLAHGALAGYVAASLLGMLSSQVDRLVLAATLPVADFGSYYLVSTIALMLLHLQAPIHRALLPLMVRNSETTRDTAFLLCLSFFLVVLPSLSVALFAEPLLHMWLASPNWKFAATVTDAMTSTLRLLAVAVAASTVFSPVSILLLRDRRYLDMAVINLLQLMAASAVLFFVASEQGLIAGGYAWLAGSVVQVAVAATFAIRRLV
jgi:O-antigen/teichoic acid export membrane protein